MKHTSILKSLARSVVFASVMIFGVAGTSHAQSGAAGQAGVSTPEQGSSTAGQSSSRRGDAPGQGSSLSKNDSPAPGQGTPDQTGSSSGWSSAGQGSGSCKYSTPDQESFLCKVIRILYGPDTPRGPNHDVDNNISAGGAGG